MGVNPKAIWQPMLQDQKVRDQQHQSAVRPPNAAVVEADSGQPPQRTHALCADDGRNGSVRRQRRGVVQQTAVLKRIRAQQIGQQQRRGQQQNLRAGQRQETEGCQEDEQVAQPQRLADDLQHQTGPGDDADHHVVEAAAQRAVAGDVRRFAQSIGLRGIGRHDDEGRDVEPGQTCDHHQPAQCNRPRDRPTGRAAGLAVAPPGQPTYGQRVEAQHRGQQRGAFLHTGHQQRSQREPAPATPLRSQQRDQHQRRCQRQGVKLRDIGSLQRRVKQVRCGKGQRACGNPRGRHGALRC